MLRRWKNRFPCYNKINAHQLYTSIDSELKYVYSKLEILSNENNLLRSHFDKLQERYEHWINDEQIYLMQRIEKLENENQYLRETYQTYQIQNEKCIQSITNLIIKMLSNQKELRKTHGEQDNANDTTQSNKNQQKNQLSTRSTSCTSCHIVRNRSDDSQYTISTTTTTNNNKNHNESIWPHQRLMIVEDQDQKTTNQSSELNPNSSTLATTKSKFNKSSAGSTNKLYFVLNDEKLTQDNRHSKSVNIVPMDDSHSAHAAKQRSSTLTMTLNKTRASRQQKTNPIYSNHERLSVQTPSIPKSTPTKITTCISKPSRIPTTKTRPPPPTIRQRPPISTVTNQKTVSASVTTNKSPSPRVTSVKPGESVRNTTTTIPNRPIINTTKTTTNIYNKIPVTTVVKQRARVSDLDALMTEQRKSTSKLVNKSPVVLPSSITNNIRKSLFSKDTVKRVQPVRSHELKLFSCHLTPDVSSQNDESILTLTPCSLESIKDNQLVETKDQYTNQSSTIAAVMKRDFSEDSLNEHDHIQKLLQQKASNNTRNHSLIDSSQTCTDTIYLDDPIQNENNREGYFLSANDNSNSGHADSSIDLSSINSKSFASSSSSKPLVHRLIFPARLGRVVFFRRILSDTDIYQKNCSKDNEIYHNVYHLDSVRDFSMEFYMLATYTSDSQLRAWVDDDDDDVVNNVCHLDEDRFQRNEQDSSDNQTRTSQSRDSLNRDNEELDWYSELEIPNLTLNNQHERSENVSTCSSEMHPSRLLVDEQFPISSLTTITSDSTDITSPSSILSNNTSNGLHSNPAPSNIIDQTNALLREIFHTSYRLHVSSSSSIPQETNDDHNENDSQTSSIITNEFQPDFYYLCPITSTTNFSKTDFKPLYHDV